MIPPVNPGRHGSLNGTPVEGGGERVKVGGAQRSVCLSVSQEHEHEGVSVSSDSVGDNGRGGECHPPGWDQGSAPAAAPGPSTPRPRNRRPQWQQDQASEHRQNQVNNSYQ